jgi:hypothetical protein
VSKISYIRWVRENEQLVRGGSDSGVITTFLSAIVYYLTKKELNVDIPATFVKVGFIYYIY